MECNRSDSHEKNSTPSADGLDTRSLSGIIETGKENAIGNCPWHFEAKTAITHLDEVDFVAVEAIVDRSPDSVSQQDRFSADRGFALLQCEHSS
jgi:hypothetical protein